MEQTTLSVLFILCAPQWQHHNGSQLNLYVVTMQEECTANAIRMKCFGIYCVGLSPQGIITSPRPSKRYYVPWKKENKYHEKVNKRRRKNVKLVKSHGMCSECWLRIFKKEWKDRFFEKLTTFRSSNFKIWYFDKNKLWKKCKITWQVISQNNI